MSYPERMGEQTPHEVLPIQEEAAEKEAGLETEYMEFLTARLNAVMADPGKINTFLEEERQLYRQRRQREKELEEAAGRDTMIPELYNKRRFREQVTLEIQRALRTGRPLAILVGDCDGFKPVNDTWGHQAGDQAISNMGKVVARVPHRQIDIKARVGGDEFAVALPETTEDGSILVAAKIRDEVSRNALAGIVDKEGQPVQGKKTMSWGIVIVTANLLTGNPESDYETVYNLVDGALYFAKENGRNCIAINKKGELRIVGSAEETRILEESRTRSQGPKPEM